MTWSSSDLSTGLSPGIPRFKPLLFAPKWGFWRTTQTPLQNYPWSGNTHFKGFHKRKLALFKPSWLPMEFRCGTKICAASTVTGGLDTTFNCRSLVVIGPWALINDHVQGSVMMALVSNKD